METLSDQKERHNKIITSRATVQSIAEIIEVIIKGYQRNYKEGTPESQPHFRETYREDIESGKVRLFAAREGKKIVGSVQFEDRDGAAFLSQMAVDPEFRNRGIGADLIKIAENFARDEGFEKIQLHAMQEKDLPHYYQKLGYVEVGAIERPAHDERPPYTLIVMEKAL